MDMQPSSFERALVRSVNGVTLDYYFLGLGQPVRSVKLGGIAEYGLTHFVQMRNNPNVPQPVIDTKMMLAALLAKHYDYGRHNIDIHGVQGVLVRMDDKIARFINLASNQTEAKNEPIQDTILDLFGYTVIAHMLEQGWWNLPYEEREEQLDPGTFIDQLVKLAGGGA